MSSPTAGKGVSADPALTRDTPDPSLFPVTLRPPFYGSPWSGLQTRPPEGTARGSVFISSWGPLWGTNTQKPSMKPRVGPTHLGSEAWDLENVGAQDLGGSSPEESEGSRLLAGVHQCAPPSPCPHTEPGAAPTSSGQAGGTASPSQGAESEEQQAADTQPHSTPPPTPSPPPQLTEASCQVVPEKTRPSPFPRASPQNGARNQPLIPLGVHGVSVPGWTAHLHVGIKPSPISCHVVQNPQALS